MLVKRDWKDVKLGICVACNMDEIPSKFLWSLEGLVKPNTYVLLRGRQHNKCSSLNEMTDAALAEQCDFLFFMDVDMFFPKTTIPRLLQHFSDPTVGSVSGLYHLRTEPFSPVCGMFDPEGNCRTLTGKVGWKNVYDPAPRNRVLEIDWAGIGCLMVHAGFISSLWGTHPFRDEWSAATGCRSRGHDVIFCDEVRQNGKRVLLDTSIDCGHLPAQDYIDSYYAEAYNKSNFVEVRKQIKADETKTPEYWDTMWRDSDLTNSQRVRHADLDYMCHRMQPNSSVLDYGAGDGGHAASLRANVDPLSIECCDFSAESRRICRSKGFVSFAPDDLRDRVYDYIVCNHMLEHIDSAEVPALLERFRQHARTAVFISVPAWDNPDDLWFEHREAYTAETLMATLTPYFSKVTISLVGAESRGLMAECEV